MKKILLFEKDQMTLENVSSFLRKMGFKVYQCINSNEVLRTVASITPDIVISSFDPEWQECDPCKILKVIPETCLTPIVYIISKASQAQQGMLTGADDILQKPFSGKQLLAIVNKNIANNNSFVPVYANEWSQGYKHNI